MANFVCMCVCGVCVCMWCLCVCVVCVCVYVCVPHSSLSERKVGRYKGNTMSIALSCHSLGSYQLTSPVIAKKECTPYVLVTFRFHRFIPVLVYSIRTSELGATTQGLFC